MNKSNIAKSPPSQADKKSWRDVLPVHPACELFPPLSPDELQALADDIQANGLHSTLVLWVGDDTTKLLDGRNRLDALQLLGLLDIKDDDLSIKKFWNGEERKWIDDEAKGLGLYFDRCYDGDPYDLALSYNAHRRHLAAEQKRELIAKVIEANPSRSDRQIAELVKRDHKTVGSVRTQMEDAGRVPHVEVRTDSKGRKQPVKKKAKPSRAYKPPAEQKEPTPAAKPTLQPAVSKQTAQPEPTHHDFGPNSAGENARLRSRIAELENDKRRLEIEIVGLKSEIFDLKKAATQVLAADA